MPTVPMIISDTGPLHYLIQIGRVELLSSLYGEVLVPSAVIRELKHSSAPEVVREYFRNPPAWIREIRAVPTLM
jgi:predicted nucleic acid-binding protein